MESISDKSRLLITGSLYLLIFTFALSFTIAGPLIPEFMRQFGLSNAQGGLVPAFQGLGGLAALAVGAFFSDKVKKSTLIILSFCVYGLAVTSVSFLRTYALIVGMFFVIGASTRILDAMINASVSELNSHKRGFYISLLHATFGLGALTSPMIANVLLNAGTPVDTIFVYLGLVCFFTFLPFLFFHFKLPKHESIPVRIQATGIGPLIKNGRFLLLCSIMFVYIGLSSGISTWIPSYMVKSLHADKLISTVPVSLFWAGIVIGRLAYSVLNEKKYIKKLQIASILFSGTVFILAVVLAVPWTIGVGCGLLGLSASMLAPFSISTAGIFFPNKIGSATSFLLMSTAIGQMLVPWLMGIFIDAAGFTFGMGFLGMICFAACIPLLGLPASKMQPGKQ